MRYIPYKLRGQINDLWSAWLKRFVPLLGFKYNNPSAEGLRYWRERILFAVLGTGEGLAFLALVPAAYLSYIEKHWNLLAADLLAFLLIGCLLFAHRIRLRVRSVAVLSITFLVGVFIILEIGFMSGGPAWLFCFAVLAGVLLGLKAALAAVLLNAGALLGLACFSDLDIMMSMSRAFTAAANFIFLNAVSAISVAVLVNGLQTLNSEARSAAAALETERKGLLETKDVLAQEITERVKSEQALQQSERSYRLLAENVKDVIWTMGMNLRFSYVSPSTRALQGWTPEEYLGLKLETILTPASLERVMTAFSEEYRIGEQIGSFERSVTMELELYRKNGSTVWTEVTASFLLDENKKPVGILGVTRDITERRKASRDRDELLERLSRSQKMEALGTLAGGVAHDLNNVLSGIVSYPDLLLMDLPKNSPLRRPIEIIQESGKKSAAIVQDLLTLARRGVAVSEVVNLNTVIEAYLKSPEFEKLQSFHPLVDVDTDLDDTLPNILGSPIHLSKTVMNLVSNAAEAMPDGGKIAITTRSQHVDSAAESCPELGEGDYILLEISDSGIGISEEDIKRIFEPFYSKKKMGRSGTGLGMAVVWGTMQDHHGNVDIQSTVGRGTTVKLYFPVTREELLPGKEKKTVDVCRGNGETILIVDDVREQREIATKIVEQLGYVAKSVTCGQEAVDFMRKGKADLVLLDMIMDPGIDGLETYKRILEYHPHQKAIIASGYAETMRVKSAQKLGAGNYIRKPYTVETIGIAIRAELDRAA
jgi:PAS domain S-box-containing protein